MISRVQSRAGLPPRRPFVQHLLRNGNPPSALCLLCAGPLLCAGLLLWPKTAAAANGARGEASRVSPLPLAGIAGARGVERYRALAADGPGLGAPALSELLVAVGDDPVERALLAGLLHRRLGAPDAPAADGALKERVAGIVPSLAADADWRVRLATAELLANVGTERTIGAHRALVRDRVWVVRHRAIAALAAPAPGENVRLLEEILARRDEASLPERIEAARALGRMGQVPGLLAGLADPDTEVQLNAVWGLSRQRALAPDVVTALVKTMRTATSARLREEIRLLLERPAPAPPGSKP